MTTTEIITEQRNQVEELEMLTKHHLQLIKQLQDIIVNQRDQVQRLQQTADSSVKTINNMSAIIGEQNEKVTRLKYQINILRCGQFIQTDN
jgi:uncharacterized coiled-coil protein SlyX